MPDAEPSTAAAGAGGQGASSGDATPLSSRSAFSVEGNPSKKLGKQEVESFIQVPHSFQSWGFCS